MSCTLCPRNCGVDRARGVGFCGVDDKIHIAKVMLHEWEEPCISGTRGSGAIFFSGCNLRCVYCQNIDISHEIRGECVDVRALAHKMLELQSQGAHNINLVTPTPYVDKIKSAIDLIRAELKIPVVYNTGGYESAQVIRSLDGYVDIFLTDIKYFDSTLSQKYSLAQDYYEVASDALEAMLEIAPECVFDNDGIMQGGVILRHLVLPSHRADSIKILEDVAKRVDISALRLSLMSQYTPEFYCGEDKALRRRITTFEYQAVTERAIALGYDGYIQHRESASSIYTPSFKGDRNED